MKVNLREKIIKYGRISLYLDFYPPLKNPETGEESRRDFLKLYLFQKPKTETERNHNKETRILAENIRAQRQLDIQAGRHGFLTKSNKMADFLAYFKQIAEQHQTSQSAINNWHAAYRYLARFCHDECTFAQVTPEFVESFKQHLLSCHTLRSPKAKLSPNSSNGYFTCFLSVIKQAVTDHKFSENPAAKTKNIPTEESNREFLTLEELQRLAQTEYEIPDELRRAFLFSALTGMRFGDVRALKWKSVMHSAETGHYIRFKVQKTGEHSTKFISEEARELLGETEMPENAVFFNLDYGSMTSVHLAKWALAAGITKTVTFHVARHTYATAQLTLGTDIYTVQKLLDHKTIKNTQRYAKIIDDKKKEAANKISLK